MKEEKKMAIKELRKNGNEYTWRNGNNSRGCYYTSGNGDGVFFQSDRTGETKQLVGTCQFSACETLSGMRRKINRLFEDWGGDQYEDPRI